MRARWDLVPIETLGVLYQFCAVTEEMGIALYNAFVVRNGGPGLFSGCTCVGFFDEMLVRLPGLERDLAERKDVLRTLRVLKAMIRNEFMGFRCTRQQTCGFDGAKVIEKLDSMRLEIWAKLEELSN